MPKYINADELMEHVCRDRLDSRERIAEMIKNQPAADVIELGRDYWAEYFDIQVKSWCDVDSGEEQKRSFCITRKKVADCRL